MAHDAVIKRFIEYGLRQKKLENLLASNAVLDYFGRTISEKNIVKYYLNSNTSYEHILTSVKTTDPFEERDTHMRTRKEPEENFNRELETSSDEIYFDCESKSDLIEPFLTTPTSSKATIKCPPAPCGKALLNSPLSSDEDFETSDSDIELGINPIDWNEDGNTTITNKIRSTKHESKSNKKQRRNDYVNDETLTVQTIQDRESNYSELYYLESSCILLIKRDAFRFDDVDRKECKLLISYRINKTNHNDIQIALIVYKNDGNLKLRRNLLSQFDGEIKSTERSRSQNRKSRSFVEKTPLRLENTQEAISGSSRSNSNLKRGRLVL